MKYKHKEDRVPMSGTDEAYLLWVCHCSLAASSAAAGRTVTTQCMRRRTNTPPHMHTYACWISTQKNGNQKAVRARAATTYSSGAPLPVGWLGCLCSLALN